MAQKTPVLLCILDGFGLNPKSEGNAVSLAAKPYIDSLMREYPNTTLVTYGEEVGLPEGQMGNSEVGHLNIGAGRVVEQWLLRINRALRGEELNFNSHYLSFMNKLKKNKKLHLVGLFSDGGVHSHFEHLYLLLEKLEREFLAVTPEGEIFIHLITDGRDTSPNASVNYILRLQEYLSKHPRIKIGGIIGRFYAMDRDKRWERVKKAVDLLTKAQGKLCLDPVPEIKDMYQAGITDEFLEPLCVNKAPIGPGESVLFWNFREDRMRQIVAALCDPEFQGFERDYAPLAKDDVLCFTDYDHRLGLRFIFEILEIKNHLGEWVSERGLKQLRVAETEKYPHVTYFLNGGIEKEYPGEERRLLPSPREVKTYDLKPEMSAPAVCETVIEAINSGAYDLIVVNFANCDMVGHTGVLAAAVKAVETVDHCMAKIMPLLLEKNGKALIIADHGNAEQMIDYTTGAPHTAHTKYPVPAIIVGCGQVAITHPRPALKDVAPTVLKMMGLPQPKEMSGQALF